jgi:hypothetical protein
MRNKKCVKQKIVGNICVAIANATNVIRRKKKSGLKILAAFSPHNLKNTKLSTLKPFRKG